MLVLKLPTRNQITEEQLKTLTVAELIELRQEIQKELARYQQTNIGIMSRFAASINERLFEKNYESVELNEAYG